MDVVAHVVVDNVDAGAYVDDDALGSDDVVVDATFAAAYVGDDDAASGILAALIVYAFTNNDARFFRMNFWAYVFICSFNYCYGYVPIPYVPNTVHSPIHRMYG